MPTNGLSLLGITLVPSISCSLTINKKPTSLLMNVMSNVAAPLGIFTLLTTSQLSNIAMLLFT